MFDLDALLVLIPLAPFMLGGLAIWTKHQRKTLELQIELAKANNDPMDVDELRLHLSLEPSYLKKEVEDLVRRPFR